MGAAQPHDWQGEVGPGTLTSNPSGDCGCELFTVPTPGASPSLFITLKNTSAFLQSKESALLTASVIAHGGSMPLSNRYSITLKTPLHLHGLPKMALKALTVGPQMQATETCFQPTH